MRKINKKLIVLYCGILLAILFSIGYIYMKGDHYACHSNVFFGDGTITGARMQASREGIVELIGFEQAEDGEVILHFSSIGKGKTEATIEMDLENGEAEVFQHTVQLRFHVDRFGIIFNTYYGLDFNGYKVVIWSVLFILALTLVIMIWEFRDGWLSGRFSYALVASGGVGIYSGVLLLFTIYKLLNHVVNNFSSFIAIVSEIGRILMLVLFPTMLLLIVFLVVTNIQLIKHEGKGPVNWLGIAFALLWFAGFFITFGYNLFPSTSYHYLSYEVTMILTYVMCYLQCMFIATVVSAFLAVRYRPDFDRDYIIILGCGIRKDGSLPPLLRGRVDSAIAFEKDQFAAAGKHAFFVPSGGQGADEVISESEAMERYLLEQGIPRNQILREDKSTTTMENMRFSKAVIETHGGDINEKKVAFATTNYHVFRGYIYSQKCGIDARGISAKTKVWFYPNAFLREFVGLLDDQKRKHIGCILLISIAFLLMHYALRM